MNPRHELFSPVGNVLYQNGFIKPGNDEFKTFGRIKFKEVSHFYSDKNGDYFRGFKGSRNASIVVRRVRLTNGAINQHLRSIQNDIMWSTYFESKGISSVLKTDDPEMDENMAYIPYEPFWGTLESFFNLPTTNLNKELFTKISSGIIEAIGNVHADQFVLNNISLTNMAYCVDNNEPKIKLFNLSDAGRLSEVQQNSFEKDIEDAGMALLSTIVRNPQDREKIMQMKSCENIENLIFKKLKNNDFIESYKKKSFAHLVAAMLTIKMKLIKNYLNHPFFYNDSKIEEVIKITNSWIDRNGNGNKETIRLFDEKYKDIIKYDWTKVFTKQEIKVTGKFTNTGSELLRFIRNKVVHYKDYRDENAKFFNDHQGPFKYFFDKFEPFYHFLTSFYVDHKLHETDRKDDGTDDSSPDDSRGDENNKNPNPQPSTSTQSQKSQKRPISGIYNSNNNRDTNTVISSGGKNSQLRDSDRKENYKSKSVSCFLKFNHQNSNVSYKYSISGPKNS